MRSKEFINEQMITIDGQRIWKNPNAAVVKNLVNKFDIRGLVYPSGHVYIRDANDGLHTWFQDLIDENELEVEEPEDLWDEPTPFIITSDEDLENFGDGEWVGGPEGKARQSSHGFYWTGYDMDELASGKYFKRLI